MDKYLSLITSEHQMQPKFTAWLMAAISMIEDAQNLLTNLYIYYDIDTAIGTQLDIIGLSLGTSRIVPFTPSNGASAKLDDDTYRIVLKAVIAEAHFDGSIPSFYNVTYEAFKNTQMHFALIDNQDMTADCIVFGVTESIISDLLLNGYIIPRPEGVKLTITISANKAFAWNENNNYFAGWGEGHFV